MVKVHINNTKHIILANIYIPPRDSTSTHYKTADIGIQHCIQHIANIPHSVLTDDHRVQLIEDVISNSATQQLRPHNTKHKHTNQSAKPHTTTSIFTRYHHGVQHTIQSDIMDNSTRTIIRPPTHYHHK